MTILIDEVSEKAILASLRRDLGRGSFVFVSEEIGEIAIQGEEREGGPRTIVVCDPLDGSHNAQVGIPFSSLSLAVLGVARPPGHSGVGRFRDVDVALVQSIMTEDEYSGVRGRGAYHNGKRLKRAGTRKGTERIETLGVECSDIGYIQKIIESLTQNEKSRRRVVNKLRVLGSIAMSMSLLAAGSLDALIFAQPGGARSIDSAAGSLIAEEAGCILSELATGRQVGSLEVGFHSRVNVIGARSERVHRDLLRLVHEP
jgi:myo-inositol-1(or 4)-monophosphatase